jgi:sigma-B regulation protein RsbU (phosphoserine phosphatase)
MASGEGQDVAAIMTRLNKVIHQAALSATFVSLFYGQLSSDGQLVYSNAGHEPPLLIRAGSTAWLDRGGTVLGPIPNAGYEEGIAQLEPGDLLICFTDGIIERENLHGEQYGASRLEQLLLDLADQRPQDVVDAVFDEVIRFGESIVVSDDMTVVAVRRT